MKKLLECCVLLCLYVPVHAAAPLELHGEFIQGGVIRGHTTPEAAVFLDGKNLRVSPEGAFVFGFGRDAPPRVALRVELPRAKALIKTLDIHARQYDEQRINKLDDRKVNPKPQDLERIRKENALIALTRTRDDARTDFLDEFLWPVHGVITGVYGSRRILNGQPRRPHLGVDIACKEGAAVKAPASGVVTFVYEDMFFSGATMVVDHGHGVSSTFLHLHKILIGEGERVERGQVIAEVGASGRVTGAHLDWRINWFKQRLDPALLAGEMPAPAPECLRGSQ